MVLITDFHHVTLFTSRIFMLSNSAVHLMWNCFVTPSPIDRGTGYCFDRFLCNFVSFFLFLLARLRENVWTNLHEIFREGVE